MTRYTYTEYYDDGPGEEKMRIDKRENLKDPVEIVIRIRMDAEKYKARRAKYKETLWGKAYKIFFNS